MGERNLGSTEGLKVLVGGERFPRKQEGNTDKQEGNTDKQEGGSVAPELDTAAFPHETLL